MGRGQTTKQYASGYSYERKLARVMERLGVPGADFNYNWDRHGAWVEFRLKGELYRFDHTVDKARARGINLALGSDCFAQIVLSLEDLARMVERGIYELQTWVAGMKYLPPVIEAPWFFRALGFTEVPAGAEDVKARYRALAKLTHPDAGGKQEDFEALQRATEQALKWFETTRPETTRKG